MIDTMPGKMLYACPVLFLLFVIIHRFTKNRFTQHLLLFMLTAFITAGWFSCQNSFLERKISNMESCGDTVATDVVISENVTSSAVNYTIALDSFANSKISSFKVKLYTDNMLVPGDRVKLYGKYKSFTPTSNYIYNFSNGIYGYYYADKIEPINDKTTLLSVFHNIKVNLTDKSRKIFNYRSVPLAVAMGLGDKSILDKSTVKDFAFTGLSHALVVSGLHIGFITAALNVLFHYVPIKKKVKNIVLSLFVLFFMGLMGFTPSIIRAGVLMIAILIGRNLFLEIDNYTVLAVIIIITLLLNPYSAHSGSLLLSYSAYLGIIRWFEISDKKELRKIWVTFGASVFAMLYTAPALALMGMYTTPVAPLFNVMLSPVIMVVCVLSFFLPVISFIPFIGTIVCAALAPVNDICIALINFVISSGEKYFSFALINLGTETAKIIIFTAVVAAVLAYIQFDRKQTRTIFTITVPVIVFLCYNIMNKDIVTVKVFDGSSEPSYVISYQDTNFLVATENINQTTFRYLMEDFTFEMFDEIIYLGKKDADADFYSQFAHRFTDCTDKNYYKNDIFDIEKHSYRKRNAYIIDINNVRIGFNHNKMPMTDYNLDFYFFGSSAVNDIQADNCYYFYPVISKNVDLVTEKQATELYDILTIKIKLSSGKYSVIKDVKNFGSRL